MQRRPSAPLIRDVGRPGVSNRTSNNMLDIMLSVIPSGGIPTPCELQNATVVCQRSSHSAAPTNHQWAAGADSAHKVARRSQNLTVGSSCIRQITMPAQHADAAEAFGPADP